MAALARPDLADFSPSSSPDHAEATRQESGSDVAVLKANPANATIELLDWAQRTRARSQQLSREAKALRETALAIRNSRSLLPSS
jgi:hypothetical protein